MNFAVISDTHFGDKDCGLVIKNQETNKYELGSLYEDFRGSISGCYDYLIMIGDVFDFAIEGYNDAYEIGKVFLNQVVNDGIITKGFIYLSGNHDFDLWHLIEYEANIINRLKNNRKTREFKHSLPAIIDARDGDAKFSLYGVKPHENNGVYEYGGLYLDNLIDKKGITFNVAYPNLYLFNKDETILFTHGQYFDNVWSLFSRYGGELTQKRDGDNDDYVISLDVENMKEMVSINFPLNQLTSSGVGQSGKLGQIVNQVEHNLKENKIGLINSYIMNLFDILNDDKDKLFYNKLPNFARNIIVRILRSLAINRMKETVKKYNTPRNNESFLGENLDKFKFFYDLSSKELSSLKESGSNDMKFLNYSLEKKYIKPSKIIYGHTHIPQSYENNTESFNVEGKKILTYNTGGWLSLDKENFRGAEIFFITNEGVISSRRVGA
jgi:predicted phosphodiesterase